VTSQELESLACLRRARDLIDRDYANPLDVPTESLPRRIPTRAIRSAAMTASGVDDVC